MFSFTRSSGTQVIEDSIVLKPMSPRHSPKLLVNMSRLLNLLPILSLSVRNSRFELMCRNGFKKLRLVTTRKAIMMRHLKPCRAPPCF